MATVQNMDFERLGRDEESEEGMCDGETRWAFDKPASVQAPCSATLEKATWITWDLSNEKGS